MSEVPQTQPESVPQLTAEQQLAGAFAEIAHLRGLLEKASKLPNPEFPKLELPQSPDVPHAKPLQISNENGLFMIPPWQVNGSGQAEVDPPKEASPVPPPAEGKGRIMIGVPILMVSYEFFESFLRFWTQLCSASAAKKLPFEVCFNFAYRMPVHMADEKLVKVARFNKCTHILFMDDDIFDVTVNDLLMLWNAKKDMISGIMYASKFPHAMCAFRRYNPKRKVIDMPSDNSIFRLYEIPCTCDKCGEPQSHWDGKFCVVCGKPLDNLIQRVDLVPFPFTLIKLDVFDKIKTPWFHTSNAYPTDSWFCDRMMEAGLEVYAHMGVRLNHAGITDETRQYFMGMGMEKSKKLGGVIGLSPDDMNVHQYLLERQMKETEERLRTKPPILTDSYTINGEPKPELTLVTTPHKDAMKV